MTTRDDMMNGTRSIGRGTAQWLVGRGQRLRRLRRDDEAQVMVLIAVMVFMVVLFTLSTGNVSKLLYNRVRAQTAVDSAADAYALWQARTFNLEQHVNDMLFEAHLGWFVQHLATCFERLDCAQRWCRCRSWGVDWCAFPPTFNCASRVRSCCRSINNQLADIEQQQAQYTPMIQALQSAANIIGPTIGWLEANAVAAKNGADPLLDGPLETVLDEVMPLLSPGVDIGAIISTLESIAGSEDVYVLPLNALSAVDLGIRRQGEPGAILPLPVVPIPPYQVGGPCFLALTSIIPGIPDALGESFNLLLCLASDCGGMPPGFSIRSTRGVGILKKFIQMNLTGGYVGCDYNCVRASSDYAGFSGSCGWSTPFYVGIPRDNLWLAGKEAANISPILKNMPWMNPNFGGDPDVSTAYSRSDDFAFSTGPAKTSEFVNPAFVVMSSSRAIGSPHGLLNPLKIAPHYLVPGFQYSRPQIASVTIGGIDLVEEGLFIYH